MKKLFAIILLAASAVQAQDITGAGATFPAPLYARWAADYYKLTGQKVNYQSIGSGAGLKQIEARTVVFGASDMPLTDDKLKFLGLFQFPTVIGGVVPIVNIKGISPGQLKLSGPVLGDIYLGKITRWNDAAIKVTNPTVTLPNEDITVVRRADGSGTTFIWTNYLSKVNQEFKNKLGEGTAINWIVGIGGKGNEGVAAFVSKLPNSIGYVEYAYVKQNKMTYVQVQNSTGNWITPSEEAFKAAGAAADWSKSYYQILTNQGDRAAWPIAGATFILVPEKSEKLDQIKLSLKFFDWAYTNGDKAADDLDYVALPLLVKNKIRADWRRLGLH
ncbi:PstS ABC-type phosphate transport system, periplasmic component [uncultured Caudovirales phage]|uniref:PstS ABC-type phosphate transport system, periplasmic component n=1 Tax=uncultured Caudovirales phage TaxID=2100421 RepID=A0A6J5QR70_9CAUD|nr:PstS ABC-type phosphate transport system, periplasmic component [uncultured Caudovirales phage]CAB4165780.1 PstS ABC-type phosphate transport system, periplasmic component [uncultured Caudovirales phage]CAB4186990.1 PstS ABC-type phosphate transport system, periplasmic component [uncultured Caudovirales phage]CAB4221256.1 PstS ABC-type phosphate transport system, periplasmic component [uncultured Caudovirales phage]